MKSTQLQSIKGPFFIHKFIVNGKKILCDINTCCLCEIDDVTWDVFYAIENNNFDFEDIYEKYGEKVVNEAISELYELRKKGVLSSYDNNKFNQPQFPELMSICMNISHSCDLDCKYCYAEGGTYYKSPVIMDKNTAEKSIDFLIKNSRDYKNLSVSFFGGEPLLNFPILKHTVEYAKIQGELCDKQFSFHITTNGVHLNKEISDYLNKEKFSIIISFDGPKKIHDKQRLTKEGKGSYDAVKNSALQFLGTRDPENMTIRGTFTGQYYNISDMMMHPVDLGFKNISVEPCMLPEEHEFAIKYEDIPKIKKAYNDVAKIYLKNIVKGNLFQFFHFFFIMRGIRYPVPQFTQCGASRGYVAISPKGDIFPCHGLINFDDYKLGSVYDDYLDKEIQNKFFSSNVQGKEKCMDCWARYFCGGGCQANSIKYCNDIFKPYEIECELFKHRLELGLWIYTVLAKEYPEILNQLLDDSSKDTRNIIGNIDIDKISVSKLKKKLQKIMT